MAKGIVYSYVAPVNDTWYLHSYGCRPDGECTFGFDYRKGTDTKHVQRGVNASIWIEINGTLYKTAPMSGNVRTAFPVKAGDSVVVWAENLEVIGGWSPAPDPGDVKTPLECEKHNYHWYDNRCNREPPVIVVGPPPVEVPEIRSEHEARGYLTEAAENIKRADERSLAEADRQLNDALSWINRYAEESGETSLYFSLTREHAALERELSEKIEVPAVPVIPEETTAYWMGLHYVRKVADAIAAWCRENQMTPSPEKIKEISAAVPPTVEIPEPTKRWRAFQADPNILTALGTLPDTTLNAFSRVFSGWDIYQEKEIPPGPGEYVSVGLILAGLTVAAAVAVYTVIAAVPAVGVGGTMKGMASVSAAAAPEKAVSIAAGIAASPWFKIWTVAAITTIALWNFTDPIWWTWVFQYLSGDYKSRFESLRIEVSTKLKEIHYLVHIDPTPDKKAEALSLLKTTKPLITEMFRMLAKPDIDKSLREKYPEFELNIAAFVVQYNELINQLEGTKEDYLIFEELKVPLPITVPLFPEEVVLEGVHVVDGDSVEYPDHPEVMGEIRFFGVDTHEVGTDAGKVERDALVEMIEGKTVTFKVDPHKDNQVGFYGRLLAVPFVDGEDVNLKMLAMFGVDILPASKYRTKHKYVDWDEYERVAKAGVAAETGQLKIYTKPAYARIILDNVDTGKIAIETFDLAAGSHVVGIEKPGFETLFDTVEIIVGELIERRYELVAALPSVVPPVTPPVTPEVPEVPVFKIYINSVPTNAKLYVDDTYTHHWTPSNEKELSDVLHMLTPGTHKISVTKAGMEAETIVDIKAGANPDIFLELEVVGLPPVVPELPEVPPVPGIEERFAAIEASIKLILEKL